MTDWNMMAHLISAFILAFAAAYSNSSGLWRALLGGLGSAAVAYKAYKVIPVK